MGVDAGFDMVPRLSSAEGDQQKWSRFIKDVKSRFEGDPVFKVQDSYIVFEAGEHPMLPLQGHKLLRFSSKLCRGVDTYVFAVMQIAGQHFGSRARKWMDGCVEESHYSWDEVNDSFKLYDQSHISQTKLFPTNTSSRSTLEPMEECPDEAYAITFQVAWALHFFGSLALFVSPFLILYKTNMRTRMKIGVYSVFLLALVDIAFSLTRFLAIQLGNDGDFRAFTIIELWSALDAYVGLIIAYLPSLRPYLRRKWGSSYDNGSHESSRPANITNQLQRLDHNGVEVIDHSPSRGASDDITQRRNISHYLEIDTDWNDRKSNKSDVELISLNVRPPI